MIGHWSDLAGLAAGLTPAVLLGIGLLAVRRWGR